MARTMVSSVELPEITELEARIANLEELIIREKKHGLLREFNAAQSRLSQLKFEMMPVSERNELKERIHRYNNAEGPMQPVC